MRRRRPNPTGAMLGFIALAASLTSYAEAAAQVVCQGCDRTMALSETEWRCLREKVNAGELSNATTPLVFLSLSQQACEGRSRSIFTEPPSTNASAGRVYRLSLSEVHCLVELARDPSLAHAPGLSIDFTEACQQ